jgi:hypothetical protein
MKSDFLQNIFWQNLVLFVDGQRTTLELKMAGLRLVEAGGGRKSCGRFGRAGTFFFVRDRDLKIEVDLLISQKGESQKCLLLLSRWLLFFVGFG